MDARRKQWNANHKELQQKLTKAQDFANMKQLLLRHHAMIHTAAASQADVWSFEDEIWSNLSDADARRIPRGEEHSLIWVIWHIARIEDVTMNMLVAGGPQVLETGTWSQQMNGPFLHTGNAMNAEDMATLNQSMDVAAMKAYRCAVGQRTQEIIQDLQPETICQKTDSARIKKIRESGVVVKAADGIVDYWSKRTVAGLLMMPATRHNFMHLNEAARIKHALK